MTNNEQTFWAKVDRKDENSCWSWMGRTVRGYGVYTMNWKNSLTHRLAYEYSVGPIPKGLTIDHLCRNRKCVNPKHLEPVTIVENVRRGESVTAINSRKTHCPRGHELKGDNLSQYKLKIGKRSCNRCDAERVKASYHSKKPNSRYYNVKTDYLKARLETGEIQE